MASRANRPRRPRLVAALAALSLALGAPAALAEPAPQQKALARDLMRKGHEARDAHDPKVALDSFKAADDIMHVPTTGFELARSQVDVAQLVEAHETLLRVLRTPESPGEPKPFQDARGYAKVLEGEILPRIPQARITIEGPSSEHVTSISVDGVPVPPAAIVVPFKINPGHHTIVASTDGGEGRAELDIRERETKDVVVHLVAAAPAPGPASKAPSDAAPASSDAPAQEGGGLGTVTWIGLGLAGAGVLAGTITGVVTITDKSSIASQCNGSRCPPSTRDSLASANTMATLSTVSFAVAGVGAGIAVVGWLVGRPSSPVPATGATVTPFIGLGSVGASGTF